MTCILQKLPYLFPKLNIPCILQKLAIPIPGIKHLDLYFTKTAQSIPLITHITCIL